MDSKAYHDDGGGTVERGFRVTGRVQGVGFRWWTVNMCQSLGIRGSVRNRVDGAVEIRALGPEELIDALEERLASGPPSARVDGVSRFDSALPLPAEGFQVVR